MSFIDISAQKRERISHLQHLKQHADFIYQTFGGDDFNNTVEGHSWRYDAYAVSFEFNKPNQRNSCQIVKVMPFTETHSWPFSAYSITFGKRIGDEINWGSGIQAIGIGFLPLSFYQYTRIRKPANIDTTKMLKSARK